MSFGHRESMRYVGHDYLDGNYFVTLSVDERLHLFGDVINGAMQLNKLGHIVFDEWRHSECMRQNLELDRDA